MEEEEENIPPFWLQTNDGRRRRLRHKASSIFLNSGVLLLILLVIALVFIFVIVPSIVSFTSQIFKPNLIKKSWDSLNLVLVLFAIVCGFLGRNHNSNNSNNGSPSYQSMESSNVQQHDDAQAQRSYPSTPVNRWYQDRTAYSGLNRLRSFNSYPDLRQESLWVTNSDERWRFYDDTHLNGYRISNSDQLQDVLPPLPPPQKKKQELKKLQQEDEDVRTKDVDVDTSVKEVVYTPPPLSPPKMPTKAVKRKVKRTYEDIGYEKRKVESEKDLKTAPPSPPPLTTTRPQPVFSKNEKKRGKDLLMTPFRKKKKKQRQKSVENLESLFDPQSSFYQSSIPPPSPAPPPPPPPPPPHFLQNLFSTKKSRAKKAHLAPAPPPPPPPPPRPVTSSSRASRTTLQVAAVTTHKPPKSVRTGGFNGVEENVESGNLSPLNPIPPPPPLPPFKVNSWKFVRDGDYVRVASFNSDRSASPDLESEESSPMADSSPKIMPLFCPSPDVNTKAENFIARFRAGLKMEKMNSVTGRSNLGPGSDPVEGEGPS
ncbi:pollen-specific leucine-rich repeat extensin-like protein 2 [Euphorbia lathyris]|uniref:pollen-specific leucine-rich repeat extensin-like protein 2 n=1 Tax=Euphorbia lathyris TaxID=212925 RepID=UPI00331366D9